MTQKQRQWTFVGLAFVLQAGWAFYVAKNESITTASRTSLLHGFLCALMTLISSQIMEWLYGLGKNPHVSIPLAIVGTATIIIGGAAVVHFINGTPQLLKTLMPLIVLGIPYYILYTFIIFKSNRNAVTS